MPINTARRPARNTTPNRRAAATIKTSTRTAAKASPRCERDCGAWPVARERSACSCLVVVRALSDRSTLSTLSNPKPCRCAFQTDSRGYWNKKPLTASSAILRWIRCSNSRALQRIDRILERCDQRLEFRVRIAEVIVIAGIDVVIQGLGMHHDAHVVVMPGEHLIQPLRPFEIFDASRMPTRRTARRRFRRCAAHSSAAAV